MTNAMSARARLIRAVSRAVSVVRGTWYRALVAQLFSRRARAWCMYCTRGSLGSPGELGIEGSDPRHWQPMRQRRLPCLANDSDREIAIRRAASNALAGGPLSLACVPVPRSLSLFDRATDFGGSRDGRTTPRHEIVARRAFSQEEEDALFLPLFPRFSFLLSLRVAEAHASWALKSSNVTASFLPFLPPPSPA